MRKLLIYHMLILLLVLSACDKNHVLSLNGTTEKHVHFHCGEVNVKAYAVARSIFTIEQDFNLTEQSIIYKDALSVKYKGGFLDYSLSYKGNEIETETVNVSNGEIFVISFNVHDPLPISGDTVTVRDKGYLYCNGRHVDFGEILLIVE